MTGPEHYREAERLLEQAARWERDTIVDDEPAAYLSIDSARRAAQAHAALATAAATALATVNGAAQESRAAEDWREVLA